MRAAQCDFDSFIDERASQGISECLGTLSSAGKIQFCGILSILWGFVMPFALAQWVTGALLL